MNIKLNVKLSAYSKGIVPVKPDLEDYVKEAPKDNITYGRKNGEWVDIKDTIIEPSIELPENSGLNLNIKENNKYELSVRQSIISDKSQIIEDDTTYYLLEETPDLYINGGTAFSSKGEIDDLVEPFTKSFEGGKANTIYYQINTLPINSKGEYNG